jgi:nudix-type nucleoside diphosphatase (YffH/AdpP family)
MTDRIRIRGERILASHRFPLREIAFDYRRADGRWQTQRHEVYECSDAAAILPYDPRRGTILLARQFRLAAYLRQHTGQVLEACAGMLDGSDPETRICAEAEEELGCRLRRVWRLFTLFASPGVSTERLTYFVAEYAAEDRISPGGGRAEEGEDIEVLELPLGEAMQMVARGEIVDAKTVILLQHVQRNGLPADQK